MPEICRFFGIVIKMYFGDHAPPHFHAEYGAKLLWIFAPWLSSGDIFPLVRWAWSSSGPLNIKLNYWNCGNVQRTTSHCTNYLRWPDILLQPTLRGDTAEPRPSPDRMRSGEGGGQRRGACVKQCLQKSPSFTYG
jgi:hypothetical protein